jgi:predicted nucleic acid-binding protein
LLLVDPNILLNAVNSGSRQHDVAHRWLSNALGGREVVAFPWGVQLAFLRLATNPQAFRKPLSVTEAAAIVTSWMSSKAAVVIEPTTRHLPLLSACWREAVRPATWSRTPTSPRSHSSTTRPSSRSTGTSEWCLPA